MKAYREGDTPGRELQAELKEYCIAGKFGEENVWFLKRLAKKFGR